MAEKEEKKPQSKYKSGRPLSEEELAEYNKSWSDMEDCFKYLDKHLDKGK